MKILDLTHNISEDMPVYPGTGKPKLKIANTYEENGFQETLLTMFSHTGTHMDAPAHIFEEGTTLDAFSADQFIGTGLVLDCREGRESGKISMSFLEPVREKADLADFLLFYTGWDEKWGTNSYFESYPCITEEVAEYLVASRKKGVGFDTISIDPVSASDLPIHRKILGQGNMVIVENLTGLENIGNDLFTFYALPLKFKNSDGAPVRAIAMV